MEGKTAPAMKRFRSASPGPLARPRLRPVCGTAPAKTPSSVLTSLPVPVAEAAVAVMPSAEPTVTSGEEETVWVAAADAVVAVASSAEGGAVDWRWEWEAGALPA